MKINRYLTIRILATGAFLLAGLGQLQATPDFTVAAFATGTQGQNNSQDNTYGQYNGDNLSVPYGAGTIAWDGITYDAADGSTGSAYITANFSAANNTDLLVSMGPGYNNWYFAGSSGSCPSGTVDFSQYSAVQFDILWDTNSTLTIPQFNTGNNWPASYLTNGLGSNYMATNSYYTAGVNVSLFTGSDGNNYQLGTFQVPTAASNGWQTVTMPYSDTLPNLSVGGGLWFQGSFGGGSGINGGPYTASFWIDNLILIGNVTVAAPPTLGISPAVQGLNLFTGNSTNINNRESLQTQNTNINYSWVGAPGPVSYSFTISSYPIASGHQVQNHIFLIPNPGTESGPDYNEPNLIFMDLETTTNGAAWMFRYKTNEPSGLTMTYGSGTLATLLNPTTVGTWTLTFNGNTNVTMTAPGGGSTNFSIPDATGATSALFSNNVALYYGTQANNSASINDRTVTSEFKVTGLGTTDFDDNFVADAGVLNTNIWKINAAAPSSIQMVAPGNPYFVSSTLPSSGYSLQSTPSLATNRTWIQAASHPSFIGGTLGTQLINTNDLPPGPTAYFSMIHRTFSQLQILLPGETAAPGTPSGKTGTPTPISLGGSGGLTTLTVNAVDANWYPIAGVLDTVSFTSTDPNAAVPLPGSLTNGTATFNTMEFGSTGNWTVTVSDQTDPTKGSNTSSSVTVTP